MFRYVVNSLVILALAIWVGSIVLFGAAVAPVVFDRTIVASRTQAGEINAAILAHLAVIESVAAVVIVGGAVYGVYRTGSWLSWGVLVIAIAMASAAYYNSRVLFPRVNELRLAIGSFDPVPAEKAALKAEFDSLHKQSAFMVRCLLVGGVIALVLHGSSLVRYRLRRHRLHWLADSGPFRDHVGLDDESEGDGTSVPQGVNKGRSLASNSES